MRQRALPVLLSALAHPHSHTHIRHALVGVPKLLLSSYKSIFPTFFRSGFECSTFRWKDGRRRDLVVETRHREHAREDYALLQDLDIAVAREGIPWPLVDSGRKYDFSPINLMLEAMNESQILPILDLFHYGYPDDTDPFAPDFAKRFADYCHAAAEYVVPRMRGPHYFTPINEITFYAFVGGEWNWVAPYLSEPENRHRLRVALCGAAICGVHAIRQVDPAARMLSVDPRVAPRDRPDLVQDAHHETYEDTYVTWDILAGMQYPELGGAPEVLDIVGVNCYSFGQMEYREHGPHQALPLDDDRIMALCDLLGICLFPGADMPDWHTGEWLHSGIADLVPQGDDLVRVPYAPYVDDLHRWQRELNRVTELDEGPFSNAIDLREVQEAAKGLHPQSSKRWS